MIKEIGKKIQSRYLLLRQNRNLIKVHIRARRIFLNGRVLIPLSLVVIFAPWIAVGAYFAHAAWKIERIQKNLEKAELTMPGLFASSEARFDPAALTRMELMGQEAATLKHRPELSLLCGDRAEKLKKNKIAFTKPQKVYTMGVPIWKYVLESPVEVSVKDLFEIISLVETKEQRSRSCFLHFSMTGMEAGPYFLLNFTIREKSE